MPHTKKILNVIILTAFILVAVFGIMAITPLHHHEPGCPFMPGEQAICPMGLLEHITAWKDIFTVSIPSVFLPLFFAAIPTFAWFFYLPPRLPVVFQRLKTKKFSFNNLYQELFSQGILNPKAP